MPRNEPLKSFYDVIVIGSGIGGLTTASLLAARGKDVLVLEQHYLPGGSAQTFPYKQYRFDVGPKLFFGMDATRGNMRYHQEVFDELGEYPQLHHYESYYSFKHPGGTVRIAGSVEEYVEQLVAAFPHEASGIRRFYAKLEELHQLFLTFPNFPFDAPEGILATIFRAGPSRLLNVSFWSYISLGSLFDEFIRSCELRAIINAEMIGFCYTDMDRVPAVLGALVLIERHKGGGSFTKGGSGELARLLIRGLEKFGGRIQYRASVKRILVRNGCACGVELADGQMIGAEYVVSNAGVVNTFGRAGTDIEPLVERRWLRPDTIRKVDTLKLTDSFFTIFAGVDAEVFPPNTDPHMLYIDRYYQRGDELRMICFCNSSFKDPELAPPGKHALQIVYFDPLSNSYRSWQRDEHYEERKQAIFERAMEMAEQVFPGIRSGLDYVTSGTPLTYADYLAKWGGGWGAQMSIEQFGFHRFHHKTDVRNLLLVGADTHPGIGVISVTMSGINCAYHIAPPR